jgi:hypothetical protein
VILADPDMTPRLNADGRSMHAACVLPFPGGIALPGRRMTEVAQGLRALGAHTTVQSLCDPTLASAFDAILDEIGDALGPPS